MGNDRRGFLKKSALLGLVGLGGNLIGKEKLEQLDSIAKMGNYSFTLPKLPYAYDAMEPFIDAKTMEIHHTKHHQAYINKLNETPPTNVDFGNDAHIKCENVDKSTPAVFRNNLGGHYNHTLFWTLLKPNVEGKANLPEGKIAKAITDEFKSFDDLKKEFSEKSTKVFGSAWCWLIKTAEGKLKIVTTPNQDNPLMSLDGEKGKPLLALDVWEHAYYLKYQNKRADYIAGWWNLVNWQKVEGLYTT
jgi:Fe-Mn family superoxide dismutase